MKEKQQKGQFFTKKSEYILDGFSDFIKDKIAVDPFAGNKDLIMWAKKNGVKKITGYDVDKNYADNKIVFLNDSIGQPQKYDFVITNPPYLHKNKANKETKDRFFVGKNSIFEDLYQVSINSILNSEEGILIVPLNFLCAENSKKIRNIFFNKFDIKKLNIFSEQVFDDTTYNVISFYFCKKKNYSPINMVSATIFPENKKVNLVLDKRYNWQFGGDFISKVKNTKNYLGVFRLTKDYLRSGEHEVQLALQNIKEKAVFPVNGDFKKLIEKNILFLRAIDSKNGKKIQLEDIRNYGVSALLGKDTSRNMAHLIFTKELPIKDQLDLMREFNKELNQERNKYFSFFLTNFRDNNRKRISFGLTYKFLNYIYFNQKNFSDRNQKLLFS